MKGTLAVIAFVCLFGTWLYYKDNDEFEAPDLTEIKQTAETLATTLQENMQETNKGAAKEISSEPDPAARHIDLKRIMLQLTNQEREKAGVPPVRLGTNPAAQLHAEAALAGCYSSHWDRWGLKPNHRYTITGGTGSDGENASGSDYCIKAQDNYRATESMTQEVNETVQGWMESPGHRRNLLEPAHTVLNIGIAHDRYNTKMIQHFSSDYVTYQVKPFIDSTGVLRLEATSERATFNIGNSTNIQIYYDPPPRNLSRGQLAHTYALCNGRVVGWIEEPRRWISESFLGRKTYTSPTVLMKTQKYSCVDPYHTDPNRPAPDSPSEAHQAWADAKALSAAAPPITTKTIGIIADRLEQSTRQIIVEADLNQILQENGPGIYTVMLWGRPTHMSESTPLSEQAIFWQTKPTPGNPYIHHKDASPLKAVQAKPTATPDRIPTSPTPEARMETITVSATPEPTDTNNPENRGTPESPMATSGVIATYTNTEYGYSIKYPYGWTVEEREDGAIISEPSEGQTYIQIEAYPINRNQPLPELENAYSKNLLEAANRKSFISHTIFSTIGGSYHENASGIYARMTFVWKKSRSSCVQEGEIHIFPSKYAIKGPTGFALTMASCQGSQDPNDNQFRNLLESFTEKTSAPSPIATPEQSTRLIPNTPAYTIPTPQPTATPQPAPTATPVPPPPRPQLYETYTDPGAGYSIQHPYGWQVQKGPDKTTFTGQGPVRGFMVVETYPVLASHSVGELADIHMAKLLAQAPGWVAFSPSWAGAGTNSSGQYFALKFSRQVSESDCPEDGEVHIFRSKYAPKKLVGYAVTMSVCAANQGQLPQSKAAYLKSFTEN